MIFSLFVSRSIAENGILASAASLPAAAAADLSGREGTLGGEDSEELPQADRMETASIVMPDSSTHDLSAATALMSISAGDAANDSSAKEDKSDANARSGKGSDNSEISIKKHKMSDGSGKATVRTRTGGNQGHAQRVGGLPAALSRGNDEFSVPYFELAIAQAKAAADAPCEETKPFDSMYAAREILEKCEAKLTEHASLTHLGRRLVARVAYRLGVNYYMTEEVHEGERRLRRAAAILDDQWASVRTNIPDMPADGEVRANPDDEDVHASSPDEWAELMDAYNHLGMVWSGREEGAKIALVFLRRSESIYKTHCQGRWQWRGSKAKGQAASAGDAERVLANGKVDAEAVWTLTLFYLAQVVADQGDASDPELAAANCQLTLQRQRQFGHAFDHLRWAKDVLGLEKYYANRGQWVRCLQCVRCAQACVNEYVAAGNAARKTEEDVLQLNADIAVSSAHVFSAALRNAYARQQQRLAGELPPREVIDASSDSVIDFGDGAKGEPIADRGVLWNVDSSEQALKVFKWANRYFEDAKTYYVLDGHVTSHVVILQAQSKLYKYLASFETAPKRIAAMHQRREGLLRNLINKSSPSYLNPKPYEVQHKEISFELGEICQEIMDANTSGARIMKKNGGKRRDADKHRIRTSGMCALDFFSHFRGCYEDDKLGELELAERVSYLMSLFCSARIVGNIPTVRDGEDPVTFLKKSLDMFSRSAPHVQETPR